MVLKPFRPPETVPDKRPGYEWIFNRLCDFAFKMPVFDFKKGANPWTILCHDSCVTGIIEALSEN